MAKRVASKATPESSTLSAPAENMTQEQEYPNKLRLQAFQVFQVLKEQRIPNWTKVACEALVEELGITPEEANHLAFKFVESSQSNRLPGGTTQLPEIRKKSDDSPFTELEEGAAWFALAYAEVAIGELPAYGHGLDYWGRWWLGNGQNDTENLVSWMKQNPKKVADYLEWVHGKPNTGDPYFTLTRFRQKAQKNELINPDF